MDVFSTNLFGVPLESDIKIAIHVKLGTNPIYIPPYHMAPPELKERKDLF